MESLGRTDSTIKPIKREVLEKEAVQLGKGMKLRVVNWLEKEENWKNNWVPDTKAPQRQDAGGQPKTTQEYIEAVKSLENRWIDGFNIEVVAKVTGYDVMIFHRRQGSGEK